MEEEASEEELAKVDTGEALDEGTGAVGCCSAEFCKHKHTHTGRGRGKKNKSVQMFSTRQ